MRVGQRTLAALGDTTSADKARLLSALAFAISVSGDYAVATATFDQARALAERVGNERAMADVLHMQTLHHFVYAEFAEGVRVGLRAAETFERESALWDLCSVQAFVIYEDGYLGSREQAASLADKTLGIAERLGHLGAAFMVLSDRIRFAAMLGDLPQVEALGPQILDIGERGGLPWRYWPPLPGPGCALARQCRTRRGSAAKRRRAGAAGRIAGQSAAVLARHLAYHGRADEVLELFESARSKLPSLDRVNGMGSWSCSASLRRSTCVAKRGGGGTVSRLRRIFELDKRWITFDGRLMETRAGSPPRRLVGGRPNATSASPGRSPQMSNQVELADPPPARPDAVGPRRRRPHARRRDARGRAGRLPRLRHARLRSESRRLLRQASGARGFTHINLDGALQAAAHTEQDHPRQPGRAAQ